MGTKAERLWSGSRKWIQALNAADSVAFKWDEVRSVEVQDGRGGKHPVIIVGLPLMFMVFHPFRADEIALQVEAAVYPWNGRVQFKIAGLR